MTGAARDVLARLDPAREALNALLGPAPASRPAWEEVRALESSGALRARAENALGRPAAALAALKGADGDDARLAEAEARLLLGELDAALAALETILARSPREPRARLLAAVARLSGGDEGGARADLDAAEASGPLSAALLAVRALLAAQSGDESAGAALLDRALAERPTGWLHALRGTLRRGLGDLPGARADLDRAVAEEPSAWALAQRADVLNRSGFYRDALSDLARAAELAPGSAAPHATAANVYFDQAFYPEALESMEKALALAPADAALLARRARFHTVLGRLDEAERGLARALELNPDDVQTRFERLSVLAMLDRGAEVADAVAAGAVGAPYADYLRGYVAFRDGKRRRARTFFLKAAGRSDGGFAERMILYAEVAAVLGDRGRPSSRPKGAPNFYLCGIGIKHPFQATVEILRALDECGRIYNNLGDPQIADFLGLFRAEIVAVDRRAGEPAMGRVERVLSKVKPTGRPTGFVTRIHPFIYRRIANDLAQICEDRGIRYRAFGAVSLTEAAWGLGDERAPRPAAGTPFGGRTFDLVWLVGHEDQLEPRHAAVVYCIAPAEQRLRLCALLGKRYPPEHEVYILAGSGDKEGEVRPLKVKELSGILPGYDMGAVMYVPALGGRR